MRFLKKPRQKLSKYAIGGIINYVCALQALGIVLYLIAPQFLFNCLTLNPAAIMQEQIWRIFTFPMFPPAFTGGNTMGFILFNILALYCIRTFGMIIEQVWGKFCSNCYITLGVLLNVVASLVVYLLSGFPLMLTPIHLVYPFFFVFALMFPESQILLMIVPSLKVERVAVAETVIYVYDFYKGGIFIKVEIFVYILHMFIFFGWMVVAGETGHKQKKRQKEFQKKIKPMTAAETGHKCAIYGRTDKDSPGMESRYCSRCEGSYECCMDHLHTHQHVRKSDPPS